MPVDNIAHWFFIIFRSSVIILGLNVSANIYTLPFHFCEESNRRLPSQTAPDTSQVTLPISMSYELDSWSQYDNPEEGDAREGDILDNSVSRKTTTTDQQLLWPNGLVSYFVEQRIVDEPEKLAILEDAMKNIMKLSCVRFVRIHPNSNGELPSNNWVNITGYEDGCYSDLGRSSLGPNNLNLDVTRCFRTRGHALHEILHTLGVFHEHMRPDRDDYIKIIWENMREGDKFNFRIMDEHAVTNYGLPYDYDSIMHYSMTAFSKNKSMPTIVPLKEGVTIGQRDHLSFNDVQKLLITYKCNNVDSKSASHEIKQDRRKYVTINSNGKISSADFSDSYVKNLRSPMKFFRDYRPKYPRSTCRSETPTMWKPFYKLYRPEYSSNPNDYHYSYYP